MKVTVGYLELSRKAKNYVNKVLNSNRLSYGPFTKKFESLFASMHKVSYAIASNSGTSALHVALAALKEVYRWKDGDEIIVPATTFVATANVVIHNNLKPVFVDVDPTFYGIDTDKITQKITRRTKAIIPVHLFGQPADMDPIMEIAKNRNLRVIEDSAETMLARYKKRMVGSFGDIGCFSTYIAHLLTTGVGGINTTNDPDLATIIRSIINHGRHPSYLTIDDNASKQRSVQIIWKRSLFIRLGHSFRITEMESAVGVAQLEDELTKNIKKRRENAKLLTKMLSDLSGALQLPLIRPKCEHSFMMYPIVLRKEKKKGLVQYLERNDVETREMLPLINQPVYKKLLKLKKSDYPISKRLINSGFYVGCHQGLTKNHLQYLASKIHDYFRK